MENLATQIKGLEEQRAAKVTEIRKLGEIAPLRAFEAEEQSKYDGLKKDIEGLNSRLSVLKEQESAQFQEVRASVNVNRDGYNTEGEEGEKRKMYNKWTWKRALTIGTVPGTPRDGVEAELDKEERKVMQECGVSEMQANSIVVPAQVFQRARALQKRDMDATTATAAPNNEGSFTIQTNVEGIVDVFLPEMVVGRLPIMRMNNLRGNVQFPQAQTLPSAGWNTENGTATEKSPKLAKLNLSPKRLAAYIQLSNQLLAQSESNISRYANRFLVQGAAIEMEKAFLKGGSSNEPVGILGSTSNYTRLHAGDAANVAVNANGSRLVWADWVKLVSAPKNANSPDGQAYVTSPAIKGRAQITPRQSSGVEGNFILPSWNAGINGYPVLGTTNLPDTFTKGGSTVLSAVIFGDWSQTVIASWGGLEIGVDPYTNMKENMTNVILNTYMDCGSLNPAAFAAIIDAQSY